MSSRIAVCGQQPVCTATIRSVGARRPAQEVGVLGGVDVVGHHRQRQLVGAAPGTAPRPARSCRCRPARRCRSAAASPGVAAAPAWRVVRRGHARPLVRASRCAVVMVVSAVRRRKETHLPLGVPLRPAGRAAGARQVGELPGGASACGESRCRTRSDRRSRAGRAPPATSIGSSASSRAARPSRGCRSRSAPHRRRAAAARASRRRAAPTAPGTTAGCGGRPRASARSEASGQATRGRAQQRPALRRDACPRAAPAPASRGIAFSAVGADRMRPGRPARTARAPRRRPPPGRLRAEPRRAGSLAAWRGRCTRPAATAGLHAAGVRVPAGGQPRVGSRTRAAVASCDGSSEQEVALGHRQLGRRAAASTTSPSMRTVNVSGSTSMSRQRVVVRPGRPCRRARHVGDRRPARGRRPSRSASPSSTAGGRDERAADVGRGGRPEAPRTSAAAAPAAASGSRRWRRPSRPRRSTPPLITTCGRTPKNAGSHSTRSASLPGSTEPISPSRPCAIAGQIVYLAT